MKHILVTFDNDEDAEIFVEAMQKGSKFDFNGIGHLNDNDEWTNHYRWNGVTNE